MRRDFNVLMSDLNGTAREKLVVTTAIVPIERECCCSCCGDCSEDAEVYAARVEMDDGQVRGVISHESMEVALGAAVAQAMSDLEAEEDQEYEDQEYDYQNDYSYEEEEEFEEEELEETVQNAVNKAVEAILKKLSKKEDGGLSTRHITALKATVDEIGFDRAVDLLEKLNKRD